jgi:selenocysteine lyase/cysteine desulfurase
MYVRKPVLVNSVNSVVHHFLSPGVDGNGYKLQPAGPGYESTWATTAVVPYLQSLTPHGTIEDAYRFMSEHDSKLAKALLEYLTAPKQRERGVRIVGSEQPGPDRMPTVSFVLVQSVGGKPPMKSKDIVGEFDKAGLSQSGSSGTSGSHVGIRYGHFYAYTLISTLEPKLDPSDGVVRVSFVHYNTLDEVQLFIRMLDHVLYET